MFKFEDNDNKVFCIKDSNVELSATFETLPKDLDTITIEWTRDGKPITNSEKFKVTKTKNAIQLAIQHVQRDDAGHYTLYAKTDTGETAQKDIELLVEDRSFGDNPPVFLRRLNDLAVKVGTRTRLLVEIRSATDVRVTWYRNDRRICENDRINFVNEGSFYCLEISSITLDDGGKWMCMAENLGGRNSCLATLNVLVPKAYKAPEFVEELRAILTEQGTVSLECKVVGVPTPILRWFKDSKEIKAGDVFALTANPDDLTSLGTYTCEAVNCMGKTYSSSKLHISGKTSRENSLQPSSKLHGPPPIFTSELKNINSKIGDSITLACQVMVPPWPKSVTWYNKEGRIESSEKYKLIEDGMGSYILEIKPAEYSDEGEWKFVVTSNEGTVSISTCSIHMDIPKNYRKPRFMENLKAILTEEGLVSFECKVVGFPTPLLRWFKDGHELKPGDVYQLTGTNSLGSYSCIARNCMGEACSSAVLTLEDIQNQLNENERIELQQKNQPPKFIKGLMSCDTKINEEFKFTVQIKATTEPVFSWYRDDLPVDKSNERYEISTEKVGFCHLTIKCVEFVDQAEWKCVATNEFGHSTSTCFLKLQIPRHYKKPRFLECLRAVLTEEGAVNLECKVIGVPQPTLRWFKDGVELKPGDIHRIISGKDGECSLGTYTCEARNCMGVVTSSATLLGYEENYKSIPKPEPANILQRHLSLSTIHEERTSQLYDTPMGDITVDEKGDVSFSFDGKEVSVSLYETPDLTEEEALQIVEMYADQISEHVTEQNIVELPPLRFVKETTQSGNLLMEAVVIDVSPDYFPPEEDMRTEADMEDISVVDAMSQAFEDPLSEQSMSKRRRKEESLRSGDVEEFFSLSQSKQTKPLSILENYVVEEAHSDEEITETDLQTFESAKSSEKGDSDKQKKVIKSDDSLQEQPPKLPPRKRPTADNKSKEEDSIYLQDISGEQGDGLKTQTKKKIDIKTITINKSIIEKVIKTVIIVKQHLIAVENEVIAQSSLMMSPTSGDSSIGIVKSVLEPINAIECKVNDYNGERNVDNLIENLMPDLKSLNHGLSIIEKCVEMDCEGKTLVQRTSVCVIESVGIQMLAFLESLKQVCLHNVQGSLQNESLLIINDMQTGIHITEDTIKSQTLIQEATALEASQRVSETIAQMQQNVPETVPLEVVTTSEMPKEANSFKLLCRYILKFQEILETSQQSDVKKETLAEIQKPIIAIQNEIHSIEDKISKNSLKDTIEEKISFKILDTVSPPLYELNKCFEAITKNVESGNKSPKILDPFILPLQEIQTGLALIGHEIDSGFIKKESPIDTEDNQKLIKNVSQNVIYVESNIENIHDSTSMTVYDSLIQLKITISTLVEKIIREPLTKGNLQIIWALKIPLEELNYCFRHIEERSTSGNLRDLLDPLNSLKENMEVAEEKLRQMRISSNAEEIKKIKSLVDQCDAEIQLFDIIQLDHQERINQQRMLEQQLSEHSQHLSEMQQRSVWTQEKCDVLTNVQQNIVNIQEIIGFENNKSFSEPLSTLKTLANPLRELSRQIANIREEILLENVNDISINDYKTILKLANPIREIFQQLAVITKASTFESAQIFSSKSDQDSLKSLAVPLAELRNCIAAIQHECITLYEIQGEITHPQISLKTARPLEELRLRVEEIIYNIVEPEEISMTLDDISVMKTMSEMSDEVKVDSSQHVVKVTETKVETAYMGDKKEEKVIEIKQLDVEASDIDEKKSRETSQQHVDIKTDVETAEKVEDVAQQKVKKVDETVKVTEEESSKIIEASKQDVFEAQEQEFSLEIQTHLLKMKEEMETVMIAVQNMRRPTAEVQTIEKELKGVFDHILNLPENLVEMNKIIEAIEIAEKSISSRKTSDVILVKYNLESLKKTLRIIIKTIYPVHVEKKEEIQNNKVVMIESKEMIEQKIEVTEVQLIKDGQQDITEPKQDVSASIAQAEIQIKKVKILIKKISTIPELQAVEQDIEIAFENLTDIITNSEKLDKAIEVINVAESKLMAEKSSDLVEIRENIATLKQILIILKSSVSAQQLKNQDIKEQVQTTELQIFEVSDGLKSAHSKEKTQTEKIEIAERVESIEKITEEKLEETKQLESPDHLKEALEITENKPLQTVEVKSKEHKIVEEKPLEIKQIENATVKIIQDASKDKIEAESIITDAKENEELKLTEDKLTETIPCKTETIIVNDSSEQITTKEIIESTEKKEEILMEVKFQEEQTATQQILPEIQENLIKTKENIETVKISISKARRPTVELQAAEKELSTILENISELPQHQQQIEKAIEKIEEAEASLSARKTSDIVVVRENLVELKKSLKSLNNSVKVEVKLAEDISQRAEIGIIEIKEELKIVEDDRCTKVDEVEKKDTKSHEKQVENEKPTDEDSTEPLKAVETKVQQPKQELKPTQVKLNAEIDKCISKTKDEIEIATASIKKVRRTTSELESVQSELNVILENITELPENVQKVEKIIVLIEKVETSLVDRKTSDIVFVKESLSNLKQCLVTLKDTVESQNVEVSEVTPKAQIVDLQFFESPEELKIVESNECIAEKVAESISEKVKETKTKEDQPQQIVISALESKDELQITESCEEVKQEVSLTGNKLKALSVDESVGESPKLKEQTTTEKVEESNLPQLEELSEFPNKANACLTETKTEIENVTASIKKVRRPTSELQAAQKDLNAILETLENLPENSEIIEKALESIQKAEASLMPKKTSDITLVKDNLIKLKQAFVLLSSAVEAQKCEVKDISKIPQIGDLVIIDSSEELKIVESNESLAEKVEEKGMKNIEEQVIEQNTADKVLIIEDPENLKQLQKEQEMAEDKKLSETKIVAQDEEKSAEPAELQKCIEKSKEEINQTIESIKKVRRTTPEIQAIERQLSTSFDTVNEIPNNDKIIEDILNQIEAAEASITIRKTSDIVLLKENFSALKQSLITLRSVAVQQVAQIKSIDEKPQHAEISDAGTKEVLSELNKVELIVEEKPATCDLKIIEDVTKTEEQKVAEDQKIIKTEKTKIEEVIKVEETKTKEELTNASEAEIQHILPEIQECLIKTKDNIETVTISIKKARRPTDELQAAEKELTIILENISQLPQNQQQIGTIIEKIEKAESSLVARKTSDIVLVKENLISLKQSLVTLNNKITTQNTQLSTVIEIPQTANLNFTEVSEELKIIESNESLAEKVSETITNAEIIKDAIKKTEKSEETTKAEVKETTKELIIEKPVEIEPHDEKNGRGIEDAVNQVKKTVEAEIKEISKEPTKQQPADIKPHEEKPKIDEQFNEQKLEPIVKISDDINVDFCIKKSKADIENTMKSIKSVRRPTPELLIIEKTLSVALEKISELPADEELIEKAISSIESAEALLIAKKTSDMVLLKQNLSNLKESFILFKNTVKAQNPVIANVQITEIPKDLKIVESNENISAPEILIEKSKVEIENTVESIKKLHKPTVELKAMEKELVTALEHLSDLHNEKNIEKVIESIAAVETSLTAKKTSEIVLIKENLSQLKESFEILKTNVEGNTVKSTDTSNSDVKILDLKVIEPSNDLKIIESNEDLTVTDETPKIEELESLQIIESEQLAEVTLSLAKSRDEIENVMFAIRKARHPPSEVCSVEKVLTSTYEQLFELPKDELFLEKAIESIELAEISLVTRGAGDLIVIKTNLGVLKESLIKIISFTNPQKAESLVHELQKPQYAKVSEIQEQKQVEEEKPQELTSKGKLETLIEKTIDSIRNSRHSPPEVQAIEKEFTVAFEKVSNLENDKQEMEKIIALIETADASLAAKRTSDIVLIKENLALVKETLNTLKLTAQSKPIEIIELQQQKPEQAIIVDEKLKKEELEKEIVDKKSVEEQQESIKMKESEAKLPLQTEIQKQQPNVNVEKLKTEIVSTIESIKKVRRPNTEIQAVERELTMAIEHVNELPNDEKKIENVIGIIEKTEASLVAKKTSDIIVVKNNLSELKQTLNVMKIGMKSMKAEISKNIIQEKAPSEQNIILDSRKEIKDEKIEQSVEIEKIKQDIKTETSQEKSNLEECTKSEVVEKLPEILKEEAQIENITLFREQESLKSHIESSIQSIKKALHSTSELTDTEKILSMAFENVSEFSSNIADVQKAIESIIVAEVSLIAKRTSDMIVVKNNLGNLKEKLTVIKNNLKPQKREAIIDDLSIKPKEEPTQEDKSKEEPKKIEDKPSDDPKKVEDKSKEEPKKIEDKPSDDPKKVEDKSKKEPKKIEDKPSDDPKKVEDKLKEEAKKIEDKPSDDPKKVKDKSKEEPKKIEDKPSDDPKKVKDKSKEELKKIEDKPSDDPKKVEDKSKEEPKKIEDKPSDDPKKVEDKSKKEPKKIEDKPSDDTKKVEDKSKEEPKKIEEKLPAEIIKIKIEIVDAIDGIKKIRRSTTELNAAQNELTNVLEHIKELPNNQQELLKIISSIESAATSLATRRTSDIVMIKEKLNSLKDNLFTFKTTENIIEAKTETLIEQVEKKEDNKSTKDKHIEAEVIEQKLEDKLDEKIKMDNTESNEVDKVIEKEKSKNLYCFLKHDDAEKAKPLVTIPEAPSQAEPKITESASIRKLKIAIANVKSTIIKVRRPTPELQSAESSLTIIISQLPEIENNIEEIEKNITVIVKAEDSIITKKTSDMLAVKENLSKLKDVLTEMKQSIKPMAKIATDADNIKENEKSKDIKQAQEQKTEEKIEIKKDDKMEITVPIVESKPNNEIKPNESVNDDNKEVKTPEELPKIEEKPKVPESVSIRKLRNEIENVSAAIKKVRRPTPELNTTETELTIIIKKLPEFEDDVVEIDKIVKYIINSENSITTKKTSDIIAVKERLSSLKSFLTELSDSKKPKVEKPIVKEESNNVVKPETVQQVEEIKTEKNVEPEIVIQCQKSEEKSLGEIEKLNFDTKPVETKKPEEKPKSLESEKPEMQEQMPEIRLDEISLKIKSEIENVIHSIKKSRRPTIELQSLEKSLNAILDLKVLAEFPNNLVQIEQALKSLDNTESSLATKKTSDMILVKNNINLLKEVLVLCKNKFAPPQEIKVGDKPSKVSEKSSKQEIIKDHEPVKIEIPEIKEFEQPSEILLDIHEKDLISQYFAGIKQDIEEVLVMIKKARRPSTELQSLHEALIDLKPKVDNLTKDPAYFETVLHIVTKAKTALLTKRTMDMILLREKVTSLESSLTLLKSTIVTDINETLIAAKQIEEEVTKKGIKEEKTPEEKELISSKVIVESTDEKKETIEIITNPEIEQAQVEKVKEISLETVKIEENEPQKPIRRRKYEETAEIEKVKIDAKSETNQKEELKSQDKPEPEIAPVPTERRRQRQSQEVSLQIQSEPEPIKPSRRRRADDLKEEEKSLPRTPETRRKRMPTFIARLKNRSAPENSILKLTCAVSEPEVVARWTKQGMTLKDSEKYSIENSNGVLSIEIKNACAQDAGEYYCFVSNSSGEIETSAFVTIFGEDVQPSNSTFTKNLKGESMTHYLKPSIVGFM